MNLDQFDSDFEFKSCLHSTSLKTNKSILLCPIDKKRNSFNAYNRTILLHVLNGWIRDLTTRLRTSRKCSIYFSFTPVFTPWPEL